MDNFRQLFAPLVGLNRQAPGLLRKYDSLDGMANLLISPQVQEESWEKVKPEKCNHCY